MQFLNGRQDSYCTAIQVWWHILGGQIISLLDCGRAKKFARCHIWKLGVRIEILKEIGNILFLIKIKGKVVPGA
jgi:hypothetical protein